MPTLTDATHAPALRSWVPSANQPGTDFPIQNLPYGRFRRKGVEEPWRIGVAIGDQVLDLRLAREQCPWGSELHALMSPLAEGDLRGFMALGPRMWAMVRAGMGRAVMPFLAINPDDPDVIVADLDPPLQPRRIALAYLAGTTLSPATRAFIAAAIDVADNLSHA